MINLYLAQILDDEKHREIEKSQLTNITEQSRKDQARQRLAKLVCRLGLAKTCRITKFMHLVVSGKNPESSSQWLDLNKNGRCKVRNTPGLQCST